MTPDKSREKRIEIINLVEEFEAAVDDNNELFEAIEDLAMEAMGSDESDDVADLKKLREEFETALKAIHKIAKEAQE